MHCSSTTQLVAAKRILRFKGTVDHGLYFLKGLAAALHGLYFLKGLAAALQGYRYADWVGSPDDKRFTSDYCIFFGSNLISLSAKKQPTVARSSTEAEYRDVA
ncbi:uncharacterized protein LOC113295125 [Papaver somniferum]|uniref:uncharacterized protein LOC113295125 n=1 Tax=Papaver somniferum TaxID=3469 RepID=UPI000E6F9C31|nr:uncharacterized protein LOC113295125 [Papaver somniferum]